MLPVSSIFRNSYRLRLILQYIDICECSGAARFAD